jgi:Icc-related predicted phosphoesterase
LNILALTDLRGQIKYAERLYEVCQNAVIDAVMFAGNIVDGGIRVPEWEAERPRGLSPDEARLAAQLQEHEDVRLYARFLAVLGALDLPCYLVPGHLDAPERLFLQASLNRQVVAPNLALIHRSFAAMGRNFVVAGFGGRLTEDKREMYWTVEYPSWEAEFGLDFVRRLDQDSIFLFHMPPAGTDLDLRRGDHVGAPVVNTLIKAYQPKFVFCGHAPDGQGKTMVGTSLVVNPGPLAEGYYAILDTKEKQVFFGDVR